jgi:hypothetical protein
MLCEIKTQNVNAQQQPSRPNELTTHKKYTRKSNRVLDPRKTNNTPQHPSNSGDPDKPIDRFRAEGLGEVER